jgi:hypothetical protein
MANIKLNQQGSALITIIVAITVTAALGGAIYSFTSTSTLSQIGAMDSTRAYYMAEAGGQYGIKRLAAGALDTDLNNNTFNLTDGGKFTLQASAEASPGFKKYLLTSTGRVNASASRSVHYVIYMGDSSGFDISFDANPADHHALNPDNWNVTGYAKLEGNKLELNKGNGDTQVSFNWSGSDSTLPDLGDIWNSYGFLTYEVQLKVKLSSDHDIMSGISFRLDTNGNSDIGDDSFYGLSYLYCKDGSDLPAFCGSDNDKTSVLLWRQDADGSQTIMQKSEVSSVLAGLADGDELNDNSTLLVRVLEQINPDTSTRENLIYAFVADKDTYDKGTINWDYSNFTPVEWGTLCGSHSDCFGVAGAYYVVDSTYTSASFDITSQAEIGIHALGDEEAEIRDMAIRFNFNNQKTVSY